MKRHPEGTQIGNIFNRNGHWTVKVKVKGRQIWKGGFRTREDAQLYLGKLREDIGRERVGLPKVQRKTLADFAPEYRTWAKAHKRSWLRDDRSLVPLLAAFGHFRLADITKARVEAYMRDRHETPTLASRRTLAREAKAAFPAGRTGKASTAAPKRPGPAPKTLSGASVNREVACLRRLLSYAVESGELPENQLRGIRLFPESPGRVPVLEADDEARLLEALPDWMRPIARMAMATGCRQGELLALRWRHVDFDGGALTIADSKSGESRRVPLHPVILEELRARRGTPEGIVLPLPVRKTAGKSPSPFSVSAAFKDAARKVGRGELRFHDLRHVAGSRLLEAGANLPEVAAMLGHKTLAMAKRYSHVNPSRLRDLVGRMSVAAAGGSSGGTP